MADIDVSVNGVGKVLTSLETFSLKVSDLSPAWGRISTRIATTAQRKAPRLTGRLAGSVRAGKAKGRATARAGSKKIVYAGVIQYGWPRHNIEPHPFLVEARNETLNYAVHELTTEIGRLIDRSGLN